MHDVETIDRQGSEPVQVHIRMPAGELKLSGGASKLMDADFDYDEAEGKPEISYHVFSGRGQLDVTQPGRNSTLALVTIFGTLVSRTTSQWSLRLKWAPARVN